MPARKTPEKAWVDAALVALAEGGAPLDSATESNHAAYPAVGVWHELQVTRDDAFAERMWPVVRNGIEFAIGPLRRGELWETTAVPEIRAQAHALAQRLVSQRAFV